MKTVNLTLFSLFAALTLSACGGGGEPQPASFPGLTVDGNAAYLASIAHVYKFDPASGKEAWRFPQSDAPATPAIGPFAGEPLKIGAVVIAGGALGGPGAPDARLYAINDTDGTQAWVWDVPGTTEKERREFADGVATDGRLLFAANGNGTLYALDAGPDWHTKPKVVWTFAARNKLWSRPLIANGVVYQSSLDHFLYALDAASGKLLWSFDAGGSIASTPALADGTIYVGAFDNQMHAIDAASGKQKWAAPVGAWIWNRALVDNGVVYVGTTKGRFFALDAASGAQKWTSELGGTLHATPLIAAGTLYVPSTDTYLYALPVAAQPDASGNVTAQRFGDSLNRRLVAMPALANGKLLLPLFDGDPKLSAFAIENRAKAFDLTLATATPGAR